jgi:hypothetical protein
MLDQPCPQLNLGNAAGHVMLTDYCAEFFTVLQCPKNPERFFRKVLPLPLDCETSQNL